MAERIVPHAVTRPLAALTETTTARSVRIPFALPVHTRRWRVVIRNVNYRTATVYHGAGMLRTLAVGTGKRDGQSNLTSSFGEWKRILCRDTPVPDWGVGYTSPWRYDELTPCTDYLLAFGYQHSGVTTHLGMGGGWQTAYKAMNAELDKDPTAAKAIRLPMDVRLEYEPQDGVPVDVILGDSISAGSNATYPVLEAPLAIAGRTRARATRLYAYGGAAFREWTGPNWGDPTLLKWQHVIEHGQADRAFIALGSNDIHNGTDFTSLQANFRALLSLVRDRVSSTVVGCTVTPRTAWTGTANDALRRSFNDWLRNGLDGITGVADLASAVEARSGRAPRAEYVITDGIHFNTMGCSALAAAMD
jgi:lysophospholipase L1-like esterase